MAQTREGFGCARVGHTGSQTQTKPFWPSPRSTPSLLHLPGDRRARLTTTFQPVFCTDVDSAVVMRPKYQPVFHPVLRLRATYCLCLTSVMSFTATLILAVVISSRLGKFSWMTPAGPDLALWYSPGFSKRTTVPQGLLENCLGNS